MIHEHLKDQFAQKYQSSTQQLQDAYICKILHVTNDTLGAPGNQQKLQENREMREILSKKDGAYMGTQHLHPLITKIMQAIHQYFYKQPIPENY